MILLYNKHFILKSNDEDKIFFNKNFMKYGYQKSECKGKTEL
jgi:hypothetical protein